MTSEERATIRSMLIGDLDQLVREKGGTAADVHAILFAACMIQHAASSIGAGMTEHQSFIDFRQALAENYPASYTIASRAIVSAAGRN